MGKKAKDNPDFERIDAEKPHTVKSVMDDVAEVLDNAVDYAGDMIGTEKGTKIDRVITSCKSFSCPTDMTWWPMRLAGACSRYSNRAMPQLTRAAMIQGLCARFLRCPYQAKVIKTLLQQSRPMVRM